VSCSARSDFMLCGISHYNKDGHFLDEYERQNQEIRERLKEKLI